MTRGPLRNVVPRSATPAARGVVGWRVRLTCGHVRTLRRSKFTLTNPLPRRARCPTCRAPEQLRFLYHWLPVRGGSKGTG